MLLNSPCLRSKVCDCELVLLQALALAQWEAAVHILEASSCRINSLSQQSTRAALEAPMLALQHCSAPLWSYICTELGSRAPGVLKVGDLLHLVASPQMQLKH